MKIQNDLYYLGVNDRTKNLFENLWPLPEGVSYNSYLLKDEKTLLFDTVDICYSDVFFYKLDKVLNGEPLDYIVINHMEPDHSGSLLLLRTKYPNVEIIGNARTADMIKGYYGITDRVRIIKDAEELSLGKHVLRFYLTPMIHWPETMMTYDVTDKTLFSGDAFGTFGTLDGGITDRQLRPEKYWDEMIRYYSNIVGKFASPVQKALSKLSDVEIAAICSTHGPVWTGQENIGKVIDLYDKLSRYEAEDGVVIVYGSMYGHTEQLAEIIAGELAERGIKDIVMHHLAKSSHSNVLRDVFKYKGLIIGSPTYNNHLYPEVESLLSKLESREIKNRHFAYFGSFTWAGAAVKRLSSFAETSGWKVVDSTVEMKQSIDENSREAAIRLAGKMVDSLGEK